MRKIILSLLKTYSPPPSTLILALSGGPDSMCLLDLLKKTKHKLILAHFNHGLRAEESQEDEQFVKTMAKKYQLPLIIKRANVRAWQTTHKKNLEEAARYLRYQFLEKVRKQSQADFILTAHHQDDHIETVLLNLIRGASLRGLKGMEIKKDYLLRPLLTISKQAILSYLKKHKLPYRLDSSNQNLSFSRNRLRLQIIPLLKKLNPNFTKTFTKTIQVWQELFYFLEEQSQNWLEVNYRNQQFSNLSFLALPHFLQKQTLSHLYVKYYRSTQGLTEKQLTECLNLIKTNKTNTKKRFGKKFHLFVQYKQTYLQPSNHFNLPAWPHSTIRPLKINGLTSYPSGLIKTKILDRPAIKLSSQKANTQFINFDAAAKQKLFIRFFKPGDRLQPLGLKGTKKLQDIFTDRKIPLRERSHIPLIVNAQDQIISVSNLLIADQYKVTPTTRHILRIE